MIALLALLAVGAPPLQVVLPSPAQTLPNLKPGLTWGAQAVPQLSPRNLRRVFGPLGLDPLTASPKDWTKAGLHPDRPAKLTLQPDGSAYAQLSLADARALRTHLSAQAAVLVLPGKTLGFVAGRPGRPSLVGTVRGETVWLRAHRPLLTLPKKDRVPQAERLVKALRTDLARIKSGPRFRLRVPRRPRRRADAQVQGRGPKPVESWTGALWFAPELWTGAAHLELDDLSTVFVKDWLPGGRAPRALLETDRPVLQVRTRAHPRALLKALGALTKIGTGLLTGELHGALTQGGTLVLALALRPGGKQEAVAALVEAVDARYPGVRWQRARAPERLVLWFPGSDAEQVRGWLFAPVKQPRGPRGARLSLRGDLLLRALAARADRPDGPRLGTVQRAGLRVLYGAFLEKTQNITVQVINARRGIDLSVVVRGDFPLD